MIGSGRKITVETPPRKRQRTRISIAIIALLAIIVIIHLIAVMHTAYPSIAISNCLSLIRHTDYTKYVIFNPRSQEMPAIQFANDLIDGDPAALVQVTDNSAQHLLDFYVYGCPLQSNGSTLAVLLKRQGLVQGTVMITPQHTLSISYQDTTLPPEAGTLLLPLQQNVNQEYAWSNGALRQIIFPSLYPVISRNEAEALQEQANNGEELSWSRATITTEQLAQDIFNWSASEIQAKQLDTNETTTHILLTKTNSAIEIEVTLTRLIQQDAKGLWFVTSARTTGIMLDQTVEHATIVSPSVLRGTIKETAGVGVSLSATLFNHTLTPMIMIHNTLSLGPDGTFTGSISYTNAVAHQPGLLLIQTHEVSESKKPALLLTDILLG